MKNRCSGQAIEVWGGIECSFNRVDDGYVDQLQFSGHYNRPADIELVAELGIKMMRYPVLWEKHCPQADSQPDFTFANDNLHRLKANGIAPIVGLVHHGSGPLHVNFFDGSFSSGLAAYAKQVAEKFPWVSYFTPINEPLTTARFCGLYGHWYPHAKDDNSFLQVLFEECKATVLAMQAIRKINPHARLIQTEDLGKTHSTPLLRYQADFENERRWLSYDLLCGRVDRKHPLWPYMQWAGVDEKQLQFFSDNPCPPYIMGVNHYVTSERYLDQRLKKYPKTSWGGNGRHRYADVEAVRVDKPVLTGPEGLLKEAWDRYRLPIAITEVHLHCTREEQLRWFSHIWQAANNAKKQGVDVRAVTAWAMLGSFDWCSLVTKAAGIYEVGLFDVRTETPRPTALSKIVSAFAKGQPFTHPVLEQPGWWSRTDRIKYSVLRRNLSSGVNSAVMSQSAPLLIIGKNGTLARAFDIVCGERAIHHICLGRDELNVADVRQIENAIVQFKPWAVVNTAGFVRVDDAENAADECYNLNSIAPKLLATACARHGIKLVTFSSDLVFDGKKSNPYLESDLVSPLNVYGRSKARAEEFVVAENEDALIIRTSAFFGPWDQYNFVVNTLNCLLHQNEMQVANNVFISPTYVPDLVNNTLDLLLDDEKGIWNISNKGEISWADLAIQVAERSKLNARIFKPVPLAQMQLQARRPIYSVLNTEKGLQMPTLGNALDRFFKDQRLVSI